MLVTKNKPHCYLPLILILIAIMLIYKEFFKYTKMRKILLRIGCWTSVFLSKVI